MEQPASCTTFRSIWYTICGLIKLSIPRGVLSRSSCRHGKLTAMPCAVYPNTCSPMIQTLCQVTDVLAPRSAIGREMRSLKHARRVTIPQQIPDSRDTGLCAECRRRRETVHSLCYSRGNTGKDVRHMRSLEPHCLVLF